MFTIVGFKKFVRKSDSVVFYELHMLSEDRFITGHRCDTCFIRAEQISNIEKLDLNVSATVSYNRFGRVDFVSLL